MAAGVSAGAPAVCVTWLLAVTVWLIVGVDGASNISPSPVSNQEAETPLHFANSNSLSKVLRLSQWLINCGLMPNIFAKAALLPSVYWLIRHSNIVVLSITQKNIDFIVK